MRRLFMLAALLIAAGCSKEKEVEPPAELVDIPARIKVARAWDANVGGGEVPLRLGLGVGVEGSRVFAASHGGDVVAFELASGKLLWRTDTKAPLAGGTGADGELVVVGSNEGDVIALDAANGAELWRVRVQGEVLSAPAVSGAGIVVRTVDGRLVALARDDGRVLWTVEQQIPRLTLRGAASPVIGGELAVSGFDNGKVLAASMRDGSVAWESAVAPPRGRTELERLADIDSAVRIKDGDVYAVGFQGRAAMLALDTGQVWWSRDLSSYRGLDVDDDSVFVSTAEGSVVAMRRRTGAELWEQKGLARRGLSAPASIGATVAVADFEGYVHFLDKATGDFVARASSGGTRVSSPPVVAGDLLLVINDDGRITAFRPGA